MIFNTYPDKGMGKSGDNIREAAIGLQPGPLSPGFRKRESLMSRDSHPSFDLTNLDCSSDRLDSLDTDSSPNIEWELRLAADPTTAADHLKKLADTDDRRIREMIAGNPNAPTKLLLELGAEFPEQLLNNPIFPLLCLEELHQVDKIPLRTLCSLLKQLNVPEHFFEWGVKTQNWEAIGWVGMNPRTPKAMLERLVQTIRNSEFQEVAKLHVNWEGEISEGWEEIALEEIETLFQRYKSGVIQQLKQLYAIAQIGPDSLPGCVIEQQEIAADPETPRRLLESLSCSEHFEIRLAVAANPSTPSEILTQLAQEQQDWIHQVIAENPNTTPAVLTQLATDSEQSVGVLKAIAQHRETPLPILKHLVSSQYHVDAEAYGPYPLSPEQKLPQPVGGCGTSFIPFFNQVNDRWDRQNQAVCVYLTDGYGYFPPEPPPLPVLWVVTPGGLNLENFPFGEAVRLLCLS